MPIQFSHIKNIFVRRTELSESAVLIQASSGMFLLKYCNVSQEYKDNFDKFIKDNMKTN